VTSPKETTIDTRTVARRTVEIVRLDWPDGGVGYDVYEQAGGELTLLTEMESLDHIPNDEEVRGLLGVEPVDRYDVNDALTALASRFGVELDDDELNELTHHVADVLDGLPAGAGALAWRILRAMVGELVVGDDVELAGRLLDALGEPLGGTDDPDELAVDRLAARLELDRRDTEALLAAVLGAGELTPRSTTQAARQRTATGDEHHAGHGSARPHPEED
jgi:hypothetical protein